MADPSATAVADGCKCQDDSCCECCTEIYEMRANERTQRQHVNQLANIFLSNAGAVSKASQDSLVSLLELSGKTFLKRISEPESDPFSSSAVGDLKNASTVQMSQIVSNIQSLQAQFNSLVAMMANLAHVTPNSVTPKAV